MVPNTARTLRFTLYELSSRTYTMHLQLHIFSASIFNWTYLRCNCRYHDNSMHVILQTWCQIQRTSSSFRYVNSNPGHIQSIYSSAYICFNIRWNVSALLLAIVGHFGARYTANWEPNIAYIIRFSLCGLWSRTYSMQLQHGYSSFNIQLIVSAQLLEMCRQFYARYTANLVPNIAHILQFTLRELWSKSYTM
jgi:hypothetical protein